MTCEACGEAVTDEDLGRFHLRCVERMLRKLQASPAEPGTGQTRPI